MKRNILRLLSISAAVVLSLASCTDNALVKSEVEAGWNANPANIPTVTLGELALQGKGQDVVISGSSVSTSGTLLEVGFEFSSDENFNPNATTYCVVADPTTIGSYVAANLAALTKYYIRAYAVVAEGMAYSDVKNITTKDLPLIDKVCGTWAGTIESAAYGDVYSNTLVIEPSETEGEVIIYNLEPYYAANGLVKGTGFNFVQATIDEANGALIVGIGADMSYKGRMIAGFNAANYSDATGYANLTFVSKAGGSQLLQVNGFFTVTPDGKLEDAYNGNVTYKRK